MNLHSFSMSLRETIGWCLPRVDTSNPKYCLRSEYLRPKILFKAAPECDIDLWAEPDMIRNLLQKRAEIVKPGKIDLPAQYDLAGGRLLVHFLNASNHNGLSAGETSYFLDNNDTPPWDTWVEVCTDEQWDFLVSWIPVEFLAVVEHGIEAECVGMLMWADAPYKSTYATMPLWLKAFGSGPMPTDP